MEYAPRDMSSAVTTIAPATELNLRADMTFATRNRWAMADIGGGARLWRLAWALGWLDIRLRYRGSMLGPFWLTISTGVMVAALGVLYSTLFKINVRDYLPFLALSQVLWGFLAALVSEACTVFTDAEGVIRSVRMPFFVFSMRALIRNVIALGHNIVVIVVVFAIFSMWPSWGALMAIPGLLALGGGRAGTDLAAGRVLRPLPRHPADREQRDADCLFHDPGDLEAGSTWRRRHRETGAQSVLRSAGDRARSDTGQSHRRNHLGGSDWIQCGALRDILGVLRPRARPRNVLGVNHGR